MSLTPTAIADAPYAAAVHAVALDDFGHCFWPVAPGLFSCPIDIKRLDLLNDHDELRAILRASCER